MAGIDAFLGALAARGAERAVLRGDTAGTVWAEGGEHIGPTVSRSALQARLSEIAPPGFLASGLDYIYHSPHGPFRLRLEEQVAPSGAEPTLLLHIAPHKIEVAPPVSPTPLGAPVSTQSPTPPAFVAAPAVTPTLNPPQTSPPSVAKPRRGKRAAALIGALLMIAGSVGGWFFYQDFQLRERIKGLATRDAVLIGSILKLEQNAPGTTYAEYFEKAKKNREERDELILQVQAVDAPRYKPQLEHLAELMSLENEYIRADEAARRQSIEAESKEETYQSALGRYKKAVILKARAEGDYDAAMERLREAEADHSRAVANLRDDLARSDYDGNTDWQWSGETARALRDKASEAQSDTYAPAGALTGATSAFEEVSKEFWTANREHREALAELRARTGATARVLNEWKTLESRSYPDFLPSRGMATLLDRKIADLERYGDPTQSNDDVMEVSTGVRTASRPDALGAASSKEGSAPEQPAPEQPAPVDDQAALLARYNAWQRAWQDQDLDAKLSFYARGARVTDSDGGRFGLKGLRARRKARWRDERNIVIRDIEGPSVSLDGDSATIEATKDYTSSLSNYSGRKTMTWRKLDGDWFIWRERFELFAGGRKVPETQPRDG